MNHPTLVKGGQASPKIRLWPAALRSAATPRCFTWIFPGLSPGQVTGEYRPSRVVWTLVLSGVRSQGENPNGEQVSAMRDHRVRSGEVELAVRERGEEHRPTLVLMHGYPDTSA